jgi:RNA ligase (TIGR02306 family)
MPKKVKIKSIRKLESHDSDRYDLQVRGNHNFFANGVLVHNSWCQLGVVPELLADPEHGRLVVCSKGLGSKGMAFQPDAEKNKNNLYLRAARSLDVLDRLGHYEEPVFVLGEVFGTGVQDLGYGANTKADETLGFRAFDVYVGQPGVGEYLDDEELEAFCDEHGFERVPVLYRGPFSKAKMLELTDGEETVSGEGQHIREGVVIRPTVERRDLKIGRVQLKSVSDDYLLRKDGTEYT